MSLITPDEGFAAAPDDLREFALARLEFGIEQNAGHADDGVERRADFVAHGGEEGALGLVRLLGEAGLLL